jgi:hypothetical protein
MIFYLLLILLISKNIQSKDIHIETYRETRFASVMISSKDIATIMKIEHVFCEKHVSRRKKNNLMRMLMTRQHNLLKIF